MAKFPSLNNFVVEKYVETLLGKPQRIDCNNFSALNEFNITWKTVVKFMMYRESLKKACSATIYVNLPALYQALDVYFAKPLHLFPYLLCTICPSWQEDLLLDP